MPFLNGSLIVIFEKNSVELKNIKFFEVYFSSHFQIVLLKLRDTEHLLIDKE